VQIIYLLTYLRSLLTRRSIDNFKKIFVFVFAAETTRCWRAPAVVVKVTAGGCWRQLRPPS